MRTKRFSCFSPSGGLCAGIEFLQKPPRCWSCLPKNSFKKLLGAPFVSFPSPTNFLPHKFHYLAVPLHWLQYKFLSLLHTRFFFPPLSISCCCFICLNFDEFLSHPQDSQTLFCFVYFLFFAQCWQHFFEPYKSFRCCFLIPCLCPAVGCQETNPLFWGGGKLQFHHFLPKIILPHFFCPDLSRHFKLLR